MGDVDELRASRARLAETAIADRRRFERALHDGPQQDLIALSVRLRLLREHVEDRLDALELVEELHRDVGEALVRLRALADEIYPSVLDAQGLAGALRLEARGLDRYPRELEAAVCLCCRAALAEGAVASVAVREEGGCLVVEVTGEGATSRVAHDLALAFGGRLTFEPGFFRAELPLP